MFPSARSDAAKKTPTASRSFARRTMPTARKATTAHSTTIRLNLPRTGSEKNEYCPESHWNARYQSQPSPAMIKHESIHHGLDRPVSWFSIACTPLPVYTATEVGAGLDPHRSRTHASAGRETRGRAVLWFGAGSKGIPFCGFSSHMRELGPGANELSPCRDTRQSVPPAVRWSTCHVPCSRRFRSDAPSTPPQEYQLVLLEVPA